MSTYLNEMLQHMVLAIYLLPMLFIWVCYVCYTHFKQRNSLLKQKESIASGLMEPASLHPLIDPNVCLGCGACTRACPEGKILGLINGKAQLIEPANCIGHGACQTACPVNAITLVFGSEKRGIDIPTLESNFETNVPGIFIAGELGGMGLIRNAIEQGMQASNAISKQIIKKNPSEKLLDLIIVGAGPAGIAASITAKSNKLNFVTIDQDSFGGTVSHFPRNKVVMTAPVELPIVGKVKFRETTKEALLEFWAKIISDTKLKINFQEQLEEVNKVNHGFTVKTTKANYNTQTVLLCLGRRGTPRTLDVEGEDLTKVVYRLIDSAQYINQHVLVVGGSDSALEAAASIANESGTTVTLSYRGDTFSRAKPKNRKIIETANNDKLLKVLFNSTVSCISKHEVSLVYNESPMTLKNDAVIICAGGILPTPFLKKIGINIETKYGTA